MNMLLILKKVNLSHSKFLR